MTDWMVWLAFAGVLVAVEIFTGTFYLLMIAIGFAAGGLAALAGAHFFVQCIIAGAVGGMVTLLLRNSRIFRKHRTDPQRNPSVILDIGQTVEIDRWEKLHDGVYRTRVPYRGALWDAELLPDSQPDAGLFTIREIRGATLLVDNCRQ